MTRSVLFHGAVIIKPDSYSYTDTDAMSIPTVEGVGIMGLIGVAETGQSGIVHTITNPKAIKGLFKSGDLPNACALAFRKAGIDADVLGAASKVLAVNVNQLTQSSVDMGTFTAKSNMYGLPANLLAYEIEAATDTEQSLAKILTYYFEGKEVSSPVLGLKEHIRLEYKGAEATCTAQVDALGTKLTIVAGLVSKEFLFSQYPTIGDLANGIEAEFGAGIEVTKPNPYDSFRCAEIDDHAVALKIKTAPKGLRLSAYEFLEWATQNAPFTPSRKEGADGATIPVVTAKKYFSGATKTAPTSSDFQNAFNLLKAKRVNVAIPLITPQISVGTADCDAVFAQAKAYAGEVNSITGKNEAQLYLGDKIVKTGINIRAAKMNHRGIFYVPWACKDLDVDGNLITYPAWGSAVICGALQLGSDIGTSLTYKKLPTNEIIYDASIKLDEDMESMLLAGYLLAEVDEQTNVASVVKFITSVVDSDNNALTNGEVVESLMQFAYQLRRWLKAQILGKTKGNPDRLYLGGITARDGKTLVEDFCDFAIDQKIITNYDPKTIDFGITADMVYPKVGVEPREGINYILSDIAAVRISG